MNYNEKMMMHNKVITTLRPDIKDERHSGRKAKYRNRMGVAKGQGREGSLFPLVLMSDALPCHGVTVRSIERQELLCGGCFTKLISY